MKRLICCCASALAVLLNAGWLAGSASADVGGQIPGPGLCDYPGVGGSAMVMSSYVYTCDFPTEINGSHWHCELGGAALQAALNASISIAFLSIGGSIGGNVGAIGGSCSFRCPDMSIAAIPNPPGAWKDYIVPAKCKTVAPNPQAPPPPPDQPPTDAPPMPAVTNPDNPNPDATTNGPH